MIILSTKSEIKRFESCNSNACWEERGWKLQCDIGTNVFHLSVFIFCCCIFAFLYFFQNSASAARLRRKGLKLQFDIGTSRQILSPLFFFSSRFYIFFQNSASVAGFRRKGLKLQYGIGTTMHPPLLPISQTSIFSTFKKLKHLTQEFGLAVNIEECRKGNWIATTFVTNLGWLTLKERVGNEQDGNARPFNLKTFTALIFKLLSCSFSSTFRIHFRSSPEPVGREKKLCVCVRYNCKQQQIFLHKKWIQKVVSWILT